MSDTAVTDVEVTATNLGGVRIHPALDNINSLDVRGVIPGSLRYVDKPIRLDARLNTAQDFTFDLSPLAFDRAIVGHQTKLVISCTAKKSDGTDILPGDPISLREEASSLVWKTIQLTINNTVISQGNRSDIIRHFVDRFHQTSRLTGEGLTVSRQLGTDGNIILAAGVPETGVFKQSMIQNGARFELTRPLTDLPMFAPGDSFIPGFNVVSIKASTTSSPQTLFKTSVAIDESPYIKIEEIRLQYATVGLEKLTAINLQKAGATGTLEMSGSLWTATNITPRIEAGSYSYNQGVASAYGTVPDVVYFAAFPEESFIPATDAFKNGRHPLIRTWCAMSDFTFEDGGGDTLRRYINLEGVGGKTKLIDSAKDSLSDQGGIHDGTVALGDVCAIEPTFYVSEPGTGAVALAFRNWGESSTHKIEPISIHVRATLNDPATFGAPLAAQPYLISKIRHRWLLSNEPSVTRLII